MAVPNGFVGYNCVLKIDNAGGTLTDISASANKISFNASVESGTYNTFSNTWTGTVVGPRTLEVQVEAVLTTTADEAFDLVWDWFNGSSHNAARSLQIDVPHSTSTTGRRVTGEFKLTTAPTFEADAESGDAMRLSFSVTNHGDVTFADIA